MTSAILLPQRKICTRCKKEKALSEFYPAGKGVDGTNKYQSRCKICLHDVYIEKYTTQKARTDKKPYLSISSTLKRDISTEKRLNAPDGMSYCSRCDTYKNKSEFSKNSKAKSGIRHACKECTNKYESERCKNSLQRLSRYGLSRSEYEKLARTQKGKCAICGKADKTNEGRDVVLSIDHDHQTGQIRGLLCKSCNLGLGYFKEDIDNLLMAIEYLKQYST